MSQIFVFGLGLGLRLWTLDIGLWTFLQSTTNNVVKSDQSHTNAIAIDHWQH